MKKMLQLILILSTLLLTFSCGDSDVVTDPGLNLTETWEVRTISAYDSGNCSSDELFRYTASTGKIKATTAADCNNLEIFFGYTDDDGGAADFTADDFCMGEEGLDVSMYLTLTSSDTLDTESAGKYTKTMYAENANGKNHDVEYSTYGRYYTYGDNMTTQILAQINNDAGINRVVNADEDPLDNVIWQYTSGPSTLTMKWIDDNSAVGDPGCIAYTFQLASDYKLRGCTDETAANYFGGENNDFGITATEETGKCVYTSDEASQACVKIDHQDSNDDGMYAVDEVITLPGTIDCEGNCQYAAESAFVGDGVCDDGFRSDKYNCEAFNWDGWDCACASDCVATYLAADTPGSVDGATTSEIGEGNGNPGAGGVYVNNCQPGCNVEDCGYDQGSLGDVSTWDCCPEACLTSIAGAMTCNADCNVGACDFYRNAATNTATDIGLCCAPGNDADGIAIDCSAYDAATNADGLGNNGTCDAACNSGACNNDSGDCE